MAIQLQFNMFYADTKTEMKDYEKKFEDGHWLPFEKVLEDTTNRAVPASTIAGIACASLSNCMLLSLSVYQGRVSDSACFVGLEKVVYSL